MKSLYETIFDTTATPEDFTDTSGVENALKCTSISDAKLDLDSNCLRVKRSPIFTIAAEELCRELAEIDVYTIVFNTSNGRVIRMGAESLSGFTVISNAPIILDFSGKDRIDHLTVKSDGPVQLCGVKVLENCSFMCPELVFGGDAKSKYPIVVKNTIIEAQKLIYCSQNGAMHRVLRDDFSFDIIKNSGYTFSKSPLDLVKIPVQDLQKIDELEIIGVWGHDEYTIKFSNNPFQYGIETTNTNLKNCPWKYVLIESLL